jgi:hypothetical protein
VISDNVSNTSAQTEYDQGRLDARRREAEVKGRQFRVMVREGHRQDANIRSKATGTDFDVTVPAERRTSLAGSIACISYRSMCEHFPRFSVALHTAADAAFYQTI